MIIGHVDSFLQSRTSKHIWLPLAKKNSSLKLLFTFKVWARLFCRRMYFFVFIFKYLLNECVPRHIGQYQTLSKSGTPFYYILCVDISVIKP